MSDQPNLPGVTVSLSDQIRELVKATRERIESLETALAVAKQELSDAKQAIAGPRKRRAKSVKIALPGKKKGGRPKGSKNKPKAAEPAEKE